MSEAGLEALEPWIEAYLNRLKPGERRALIAKIGRTLRQKNAERIRDNVTPDGQAMEPRRVQRDRQGRIRRRKTRMFPKIALARNLKLVTRPEEVELTFNPRVSGIASVHHYGGEDKVDRRIGNSIRARYAARPLLGIPDADRAAIEDEVLAWFAG